MFNFFKNCFCKKKKLSEIWGHEGTQGRKGGDGEVEKMTNLWLQANLV